MLESASSSATSSRESPDAVLDTLRSLIAQCTERRVELLELQREHERLTAEVTALTHQAQERSKYAKGFASAFSDMVSAFESSKKKKPKP